MQPPSLVWTTLAPHYRPPWVREVQGPVPTMESCVEAMNLALGPRDRPSSLSAPAPPWTEQGSVCLGNAWGLSGSPGSIADLLLGFEQIVEHARVIVFLPRKRSPGHFLLGTHEDSTGSSVGTPKRSSQKAVQASPRRAASWWLAVVPAVSRPTPWQGCGGHGALTASFPLRPCQVPPQRRWTRDRVRHVPGRKRSRFSESGWYFNGPLNVKRMFPSRVQASPSSSLCDRGVGWGWRGRGGGRQAWFPDRLHAMPRGSGFTTPMQQGQTPIPSPEVCMDDAIKSVYGCLRPFKDIHKDPALASQVPASNTYGVYILVGEAEHEQDA